jgi:hypothetical protein
MVESPETDGRELRRPKLQNADYAKSGDEYVLENRYSGVTVRLCSCGRHRLYGWDGDEFPSWARLLGFASF